MNSLKKLVKGQPWNMSKICGPRDILNDFAILNTTLD
jgi:hypothetical protein